MSRLEKLIESLCAEGVEFKQLSEVGEFYGGLTGKSKDDFNEGNQKLITYTNVFTNASLNLDVDNKVRIGDNEKQNILEYGDIIFTSSSETQQECGMSSVVTVQPNEMLYLNSFCFIFRFFDKEIYLPEFSKYIFRSVDLRKQIIKTANGVTRFNISKEKMKKVNIPIPPIEVQKEIIRILDTFTNNTENLITELIAEKNAREKQYQYYKEEFFKENDRQVVKLGDIATISRGGNFKKTDFSEVGIPCIHYGQIYTKYGFYTNKTITSITEEAAKKAKYATKNDIIMAVTSENIQDVCKAVAWLGEEDIAIGGHTAIIKHKQNAKYLSYYFSSSMFSKQKARLAQGTKVLDVAPNKLLNVEIPLPSLEEQDKIVDKLDRLSKSCEGISIMLQEEIEMRKKQYEYYRDKLLRFKELD